LFLIAEIKTEIPQKEAYDTEPVSQRIILHEEKGMCDSREAEKDIEVTFRSKYFWDLVNNSSHFIGMLS
jgi:hypothetical protein